MIAAFALEALFDLKTTVFKHQIGFQANKHVHEQL